MATRKPFDNSTVGRARFRLKKAQIGGTKKQVATAERALLLAISVRKKRKRPNVG